MFIFLEKKEGFKLIAITTSVCIQQSQYCKAYSLTEIPSKNKLCVCVCVSGFLKYSFLHLHHRILYLCNNMLFNC